MKLDAWRKGVGNWPAGKVHVCECTLHRTGGSLGFLMFFVFSILFPFFVKVWHSAD